MLQPSQYCSNLDLIVLKALRDRYQERRHTSNAEVTQAVDPGELVHHRPVRRCPLLLPQLPQPCELEKLLWEEEARNRIRVWRERR